jgi:hypothetical protein
MAPEALGPLRQPRGLGQAAPAGDHRGTKGQQPHAGRLIGEPRPVPGAVPRRRGAVEVGKEGAQEANICDPWEGLLGQRGRKAELPVDVLLAGKRDRRLCALRQSRASVTIA